MLHLSNEAIKSFLISAGVFCAIVSHPADTIVSKLNQKKGSNFVDVAKSLGLIGLSCKLVFFFCSIILVIL